MTPVVININTPAPYPSTPGDVPHKSHGRTYGNQSDLISDQKSTQASISPTILGNLFKDPEFVELLAKKVSDHMNK